MCAPVDQRCGPIYQPTVFWSETIGTGPPGRERLGMGRENLKSGKEEKFNHGKRMMWPLPLQRRLLLPCAGADNVQPQRPRAPACARTTPPRMVHAGTIYFCTVIGPTGWPNPGDSRLSAAGFRGCSTAPS